jgi:hypothetical protein
MTRAPGAWRQVIGVGPTAGVARRAGIGLARRPQARRPASAPAAPGRLPPACPHGGHAGAAAPCRTRGPALPCRAHGGRQARRLDGSSPRPCSPPVRVRRRATPVLHRLGTRLDRRHGGLQGWGEGVDQAPSGRPHGRLGGAWDGRGAGRHPVGARRVPPGVRRGPARCAGRGPALRQRRARGPAEPHVTAPPGAPVSHPRSHRRTIGCQPGAQPLPEPGTVMAETTAGRHARWPRPCLGLGWAPGLPPLPRREAPRQPRRRMPRLRCGPAGSARVPVLGPRGGVARVEDTTIGPHAGREAWAPRRRQADRPLRSGHARAPRRGPRRTSCWRGPAEAGRWLAGRHVTQTASLRGV